MRTATSHLNKYIRDRYVIAEIHLSRLNIINIQNINYGYNVRNILCPLYENF